MTTSRLTAIVTFLPIGVKAIGVETNGKECGSGLSSRWWGEGALRDEPKQRLRRRLRITRPPEFCIHAFYLHASGMFNLVCKFIQTTVRRDIVSML